MSQKLKISSYGQGRALVFLHGWGVNSGVWQPIIPLLETQYRVTCIDLPGFGLNREVEVEPYSMDGIADVIAEALPDNCTLIGWSLGGLIAQNIALRWPGKLLQLVTICSTPKFAKSDDWPGIDPKILGQFSQQLGSDFSKTLDRFLAIQAMGSPSARQDVKALKQAIEAYPQPSSQALMGGLSLLEETDLRTALKDLSVPFHAFLGRLDSLVPVKIAESVNGLSSYITTEVITNCAHAPFMSDPEDFISKLTHCLQPFPTNSQ